MYGESKQSGERSPKNRLYEDKESCNDSLIRYHSYGTVTMNDGNRYTGSIIDGGKYHMVEGYTKLSQQISFHICVI